MWLIHKCDKNGEINQKYYKCQKHYNYPQVCRSSNEILYSTIKQIVDKILRLFILKIAHNENLINSLTIELKKNNHILENEEILKKHKDRYETLIKVTKKLYEDYASSVIDLNTYKLLISEYQEEQKELQIKIDKLEHEIKKALKTEDALLKLREVALKYINEIEITQEMVNDLVS